MDGIRIRYGSYQVVLKKDHLGQMPRTNFRKLLKLAFRDLRNQYALKELKTALADNVAGADAAHKQAAKEFADGWKLVHPRSRTKAAVAIRQENNRLHNAVKRTKAELNSAETLLKIYNEMEEAENG